ncbi:hypothetical protein [Streptomyces sp. SID3343]|uniref:hypothetical protein n=1 Tax=Streptomyces sp. SID3343 TaxID=2690260 RepID=UPI00136F4864|nr:hypothetical protein [Streptomyces sp. SID3343]MYV98449.1 hypothetical protein [Streptomyces sp. SID3343]
MGWVPHSCTLPAEEQPLRVAEFDTLFADALLGAERPGTTRARLVLDTESETLARNLAERETDCCSFFTFAFEHDAGGRLLMDVTVPEARVAVLDALVARAGESAKGARR